MSEATAKLRAIPGVETAKISEMASRNGFQTVVGIAVELRMKSGYTIVNPPKLVDLVIRTAWSANHSKPESTVLMVESEPQINVADAASQAGWKEGWKDDRFHYLFSLSSYDIQPRLGAWPGPTPETPRGLTAKTPRTDVGE